MANKYALKLVLSDGTTAEAGVIEVPDGKAGADGADGKKGADGYTPVKGVDYFTDADKSQFVLAVLSALPFLGSAILGEAILG